MFILILISIYEFAPLIVSAIAFIQMDTATAPASGFTSLIVFTYDARPTFGVILVVFSILIQICLESFYLN